MVNVIEILATIELLDHEQGRKTSFVNGYRPLFNFPEASTKVSGSIKLINMDSFAPGSKGDVIISFIKGMIDNDYFRPGTEFTFDEGREFLGTGRIKEVINAENVNKL